MVASQRCRVITNDLVYGCCLGSLDRIFLMTEEENEKEITMDLEIAASIACIAIIGSFAVYWLMQIEDVLALLKMAYG